MDSDPAIIGPSNPAQPSDVVELKVFSDPNSAELAKAILEANGFECWIAADDCGGMLAAMDAVRGVKLSVRRSDSDAAKALLASAPASSSQPATDEPSAPAFNEASARLKLSLPQIIAGVVVGVLLCLLFQWTSRLTTRTYRYDWDGDGKTDEILVYRDGRCVAQSYDRNFDGRWDFWTHFDSDGKRFLSNADDNFDGVSDVRWNYTNGVPESSSADTDFNGTPDVVHTFKHDLVSQSDWRPNGTNIITLRQFFRHGILVEEWRDTNLDGTFDVTMRYDAFQNVIQTNTFKLLSPVPK